MGVGRRAAATLSEDTVVRLFLPFPAVVLKRCASPPYLLFLHLLDARGIFDASHRQKEERKVQRGALFFFFFSFWLSPHPTTYCPGGICGDTISSMGGSCGRTREGGFVDLRGRYSYTTCQRLTRRGCPREMEGVPYSIGLYTAQGYAQKKKDMNLRSTTVTSGRRSKCRIFTLSLLFC